MLTTAPILATKSLEQENVSNLLHQNIFYRLKSSVGIFLSSFSIIRNWKKLTTINLNNPDAKALSSLQGIRFYNVVGVIIAHTFTINMAVPILNPRYMESVLANF